MKGIHICCNDNEEHFAKGGESMNSKHASIIGVIILLSVAGYFLFSKTNSQQPSSSSINASQTQESDGETEGNTNTQSKFDKRFVAYSEDNLREATKNGRAIVFFHAGWCPMCSQAENDLKSNFEKVPPDVTILKTDYDTSKELKAKYGITIQDSWVQVDKNGNKIVLWNSGGEGLKSLLANLKLNSEKE